jgi:hypothetical protein
VYRYSEESLRRKIACWIADISSLCSINDDDKAVAAGGRASEGVVSQPEVDRFRELPPAVRAAADRAAVGLCKSNPVDP